MDFVHYRAQLFLRRTRGCRVLHRFCSTKFRISFGRTFSEAALSSLAVAALCCVLHARNISLDQPSYDRDWFHLLIQESNQTGRVREYTRELLAHTPRYVQAYHSWLPAWTGSPIFGVWMTCMSILVVHHWFDRTCEERSLFWDDEVEDARKRRGGGARAVRAGTRDHLKRTPSLRSMSTLRSPAPGSPRSSISSVALDSTENLSDIARSRADARGDLHDTQPIDPKPMASWYESSLARTVIDLFIHASIFAGRFDMRQLLAASQPQM